MTQSSNRHVWKRRSTMLFAAFAIFAGGAYAGMTLSTHASVPTYIVGAPSAVPVGDADLTEFWRVWRLMDEKFVYASTTAKHLTNEERIQGAIEGMVTAFGDDYSVYMPPVEAGEFEEEMSGEFSGVGMEVGLRDNIITVISPIEGTPAKKAGILAGDRVLSIDKKSTKGLTVDEAVKLIRGEKGTSVTLQIYRESDHSTKDLSIVRDTISVPTVKTEIKKDVFVVHLYTFNQVAHAKFAEAMRQYMESGLDTMVLDLRGNPGGYMQTAIDIASMFIPKGEIVLRERVGNDGQEILHRSSGITLGTHVPKKMVVLIDKGSASASEILAGALQEHGVATLLGETSFGKGTVQELVELPSNASLKVTIARWFTPEGNSINKLGLTPDVVATTTPEDLRANNDTQLQAAIDFVRK